MVTLDRKYVEHMHTNHQCSVVSPCCINIHNVHQVWVVVVMSVKNTTKIRAVLNI